jgi:hypothetical protein
VKLDGARSDQLDDALQACFINDSCGRGISIPASIAYSVNAEGAILTRAGRREAAKLAATIAAQERAEAEVEAAGKLPRETLEAIQAEHDKHIALQIKAAEVRARNRDAAVIAAQEAAVAAERPAAKLYVRRGAVFRKAEEARLRPGETVYQRQPGGDWWAAGLVDSSGALPPEEIRL